MANAFQVQLDDVVAYTEYVATFADPARTIVDIEPWSYIIDAEVLTANITQTVPQSFDVPMMGDADFVLTSMSGVARRSGGANTAMIINPAVLVQITNLTTGRTFFNQPTPLPFFAGTGGFPNIVMPQSIPARSTLRLRAISAQGISFTGFYFAYHGARIWYG